MSWQPTPMNGGASIVGVAITLAVSGCVERHCRRSRSSRAGLAVRARARRIRRDVEQHAVVREVRDERVRVRAAIRVDALQELRLRRVREVEDADPLEARRSRRRSCRSCGSGCRPWRRPSAACRSTGTAGECPLCCRESETSFCGPRHRKLGEQLVRVRVEDPEAVVVAGDRDVAPDRDVRVRAARRRVVEAVVDPHVRAVRCGRGLDRKDACGEREQDEEPAGGGHAAGC